MLTLQRVAQKYGMECLLAREAVCRHQRLRQAPQLVAGQRDAGNLLEPGETPHDNMQFLVFCAAVIRAVHKYAELLRAVVATANNDHRLGANEAPPAIISIFLGDQFTDVFRAIKRRRRDDQQGQPGDARASASIRCRRCPSTRATATARARLPSPATSSSSAQWAAASRSRDRWWR